MSYTSVLTRDDKDPTTIYYNASIINNNTIDAGFAFDPVVRFNETRSAPILENTDDYEFSIVRFSIDGANKNLPILIPVIQTGPAQNNPNLTVYSVSIDTPAGVLPAVPLIFIPEETATPVPSVPVIQQDITTNYYFVYTFQTVVKMVNVALQTAHTNAGLVNPAPFISYNASTTLFTLFVPTANYGQGAGDRHVWFNSNLYGLISNFPAFSAGSDNPNGRDWDIQVPDPTAPTDFTNGQVFLQGGITNINQFPINGNNYWVIQQDYESISTLWSPIESIVFQSIFLPILPEYIGTPVRFGQGSSNIQVSTSQNAFAPIITDISIGTTSPADYRSFIAYNPTAEYRMTSMLQRQVIQNVDIQVFWKNRLDGRLTPLTLFNLSSCSIKIMFRKKRSV